MLLTTLIAENAGDLLAPMEAIKRALKQSPEGRSTSNLQHEFEQGGATVSIRDWGQWQVPEGEEDDGDYDWEEMTPKSSAALKALVDGVAKQFPGFTFSPQTGEKNYLYVYIKPKK